jgi:hypothetical protein
VTTDDQDLMGSFLDLLAASALVDALLKLVMIVGTLGIVASLIFLVMSSPKGPRR